MENCHPKDNFFGRNSSDVGKQSSPGDNDPKKPRDGKKLSSKEKKEFNRHLRDFREHKDNFDYFKALVSLESAYLIYPEANGLERKLSKIRRKCRENEIGVQESRWEKY